MNVLYAWAYSSRTPPCNVEMYLYHVFFCKNCFALRNFLCTCIFIREYNYTHTCSLFYWMLFDHLSAYYWLNWVDDDESRCIKRLHQNETRSAGSVGKLRTGFTTMPLLGTFRVIPYLSYFRTGLVSQQRSYITQQIWAALCYYWIITILMGKWAKHDLSDLENDLLNNSMKSISWQLINITPKKLYTRNKLKLSNRFWENWQKVAKQPNLTLFGHFGVIKPNPSFDSSLVPSLGSFLHK